MKSVFYFGLMLVVLLSCIKEYDPNIADNTKKVVIDGLLTNAPGPHKVSVGYSAAYRNKTGYQSISGAKLSVRDNLNNVINLLEIGNGVYQTPNDFRGIAGRTYVLLIRSPDGKNYESIPEQLRIAPAIDTVYTTGLKERFASGGARIEGVFPVYLESQDPATSTDFYRWRYHHYNTLEFCQLFLSGAGDGRPAVLLKTKCCQACWSIETCLGCINVGTDQFLNGKKMRSFLTNVPYRSKDPYFMIVEQQSLSRAAYEFWKSADEQINNSGGIFDTPPATIQGNLYNVQDASEQVLGYFTVAGVSRKSIRIRRDQETVGPLDFTGSNFPNQQVVPGCIECANNASRTPFMPVGW